MPIKNKGLFIWGLAIACLVSALDLYSKRAIFSMLDKITLSDQPTEMALTSFFSLIEVWNSGVSFGMLSNVESAKYLIPCTNIAIALALIIWLYRASNFYLATALGLIIGGAFGNLIDRWQNGAVADFLDFHLLNYHWPAFNLADSAVFVGVVMLLLENFFVKNNAKENTP